MLVEAGHPKSGLLGLGVLGEDPAAPLNQPPTYDLRLSPTP